mmetsp:Transcript_10297/g.17077  ORF Transcript_10297/g.17077 Transcript_10297/m.17077 type:complete len:416 (-) Transcript_10297:357-1604(-)
MRPVDLPGEQAPLLKSGSSFQLEDDTEVIQVTSQRGLNRKASLKAAKWISFDLSSGGNESTDHNNSGKRTSMGFKTHFFTASSRTRGFKIKLLLVVSYFGVIVWTLLVLLGPLILSFMAKSTWCRIEDQAERNSKLSGDGGGGRFMNSEMTSDEKHYNNPDYNTDPCRYLRLPWLAGLTLEECDFCRRMLVSVLLGGAIGYERRSSDRPAGIRTMGLVSLGACFFTVSSISAFKSSTMGWDASRVTAALPSGVGFLGAALIWKGTVNVDSQEMHQVHGLTTAASVWLSAAIGVGAGGALYFVSVYSTMLIVLVLRFGPKLYLEEDEPEEEECNVDADNGDRHEADPEPPKHPEELEETLHPVDFTKSERKHKHKTNTNTGQRHQPFTGKKDRQECIAAIKRTILFIVLIFKVLSR